MSRFYGYPHPQYHPYAYPQYQPYLYPQYQVQTRNTGDDGENLDMHTIEPKSAYSSKAGIKKDNVQVHEEEVPADANENFTSGTPVIVVAPDGGLRAWLVVLGVCIY